MTQAKKIYIRRANATSVLDLRPHVWRVNCFYGWYSSCKYTFWERGTWQEAMATADAHAQIHREVWHYHGPTDTDPDPGKIWCYNCDSEVWGMDGGYICTGCGHQSEG